MLDQLRRVMIAAAVLGAMAAPVSAKVPVKSSELNRPVTDELIYFLLPDRFAQGSTVNDRGGLMGTRLQTGFDPTDKAFYHGGDLKGLLGQLDYIKGLGATAIWLGPIYKNKPVQGALGQESAGYHGYWILDFTDVDPHFGTRADLKTLVDTAHSKGLKVYLDIITNHTADVIQYKECPDKSCAYRSEADYPYDRLGGVTGAPINSGFAGPEVHGAANFSRLVRPDYAYTPIVPPGETHAKAPAWLNDPLVYHNRGDTDWAGESALLGDFSGLDDLFTESPRVVQGFIDIYGAWIDDFGIDGFRIDTAKHVNPEFWQAFIPAMKDRAKRRGIADFYIFGEYYDQDAAGLARAAKVNAFPALLDFGLQRAMAESIAGEGGTDRLARVFALDTLYPGGEAQALMLPTFTGNHDMGRFAYFVRKAQPKASDDEVFRRVILAHAMILFGRGVPVLYYGDEQGFAGSGGDQEARQDMFANQVASFQVQPMIGRPAGTTIGGQTDHFDPQAPLYRVLAQMAEVRAASAPLRQGRLTVRLAGDHPGLFAFSRKLAGHGEVLVVLNTAREARQANIRVDYGSRNWQALMGSCAPTSQASGSYAVKLDALSVIVCSARPRKG